MASSQNTPGSTFAYILSNHMPDAVAWVRGNDAYSAISGLVKFYETPYEGVLVEAEFFNLPGEERPGSTGFYAMHIHEFGDCSDNFAKTGDHFAHPGQEHPYHAGDLLPLFANQGYSWMSFYDKRFTIQDIVGRSVVVHVHDDDFHTQPSGNSGAKIACGVIQPM